MISAAQSWIHEFPFLWATGAGIVGVIFGTIAMGIVASRMFPFQKAALQELAKSQEATLNSKDSHIRELEVRYDETVAYKDNLYRKMETERDKYREDLHAERNARGTDQKRILELESRPDLGSLQDLLRNQESVMKGISDTLISHMESDAKIFGGIQASLAAIPAAIREQSVAFDARQAKVLEAINSERSKTGRKHEHR